MQFLKTLFWVVLTAIIVIFSKANWNNVPVKLWGGLIADVKLPLLLVLVFLLGFLPTLIVYRTKMWALRRRLEPLERNAAHVPAAPVAVPAASGPPTVAAEGERLATDTKVWPAV
jgi:uncharacterized integral membrane protein